MTIIKNLWLGKLLERGIRPVTIALSVTLFMLLVHVTIGEIDNSDGWLWNALDAIYLGVFTWLVLFCAQKADQDLLDSPLQVSPELWNQRSLSSRDARIETLVAITIGLSIGGFSWFVETVDPNIAIHRLTGERAAIIIRWVIDSVLFIHLISMILRHRHWLQRFIKNHLRVDLLHVDDLSVLSSGFVTWIAVEAIIVGAYVLLLTFFRDANIYEFLRILAGLAIVGILAVLLFTPILNARRKIMQIKAEQRLIATNGLQGEKIKNGELAIASNSEHYTTTELLSYLRFIDSVWEWPVKRNLARLGFYALIPPMAWVLSALVEIGLDSQIK